jgi:hypothetical protein
MKFMMERARATKDIDFVLDVVRLRNEPLLLGAQLDKLGYAVVDGLRYSDEPTLRILTPRFR